MTRTLRGLDFNNGASICGKSLISSYKSPLYISIAALFFFCFASCRTFSPVQEAAGFETIDAIVPQWTPYAEKFGGGLSFFAGKSRTPPLEFWVLRADLREPGLSIVVSGPEPVNGNFRENHLPAGSVSSFVERYHCIAGINANPFSPSSAKPGEDRLIDGITVSNGVLVARPDPRFDALVFYADDGGESESAEEPADGGAVPSPRKRAAILSQEELAALSRQPAGLRAIANAVGGFWIVLREGTLVQRVLDQAVGGKGPQTLRHPRSAAGLSADGNTLYLLAVDGRRSASVGVTEAELALMLKQIGAYDGLHFDGGGSTTLALRSLRPEGGNPYGRARPVNVPVHNGIPGWERAVASCLGIRIGGKPE
jgi:hypothetical protein